tara:strand:- start:84 stop:656 length:573 start_codon:yes stop_codon:yes gene_type:complete
LSTFLDFFIERDFLLPLLADLIATDTKIPIKIPTPIVVQGISELEPDTTLFEITELSNSEIKNSEYHSARISTGFPVGHDSIETVLDKSESFCNEGEFISARTIPEADEIILIVPELTLSVPVLVIRTSIETVSPAEGISGDIEIISIVPEISGGETTISSTAVSCEIQSIGVNLIDTDEIDGEPSDKEN